MRDWNLRVILRQIWAEQGIRTGGWSIQRSPSELDQRVLGAAADRGPRRRARGLGRRDASSTSRERAGGRGARPRRPRERRSPYQGLVPYTEADADWFFGRDEWCEVVGDNLRAYRITVLYGASGVGKSSVLRAGLLRRLDGRGARARRRLRRPAAAAGLLLGLEPRRSARRAQGRGRAPPPRSVAPELADEPPEGVARRRRSRRGRSGSRGRCCSCSTSSRSSSSTTTAPATPSLDELAAALRQPRSRRPLPALAPRGLAREARPLQGPRAGAARPPAADRAPRPRGRRARRSSCRWSAGASGPARR